MQRRALSPGHAEGTHEQCHPHSVPGDRGTVLRVRRGGGAAIAVGLVISLVLLVMAADRRPQGDITRIVPYVLAAVLLWAVVVGVAFGPRRGAIVALVGGAVFLLAAGLYVVFVAPIDYAECEQLFLEVSNDPCREHSDLGWAVFFLVGAICGGALSLSVSRPRAQSPA